MSPDKIKLYLGGDFCQGASSLKLAEVVCGSPVGASRCGEEKAANVHRVTIHPPLRAAGSLKKVNSQLLWSTLLWVTCSFSKGEEMETVATATRMRSGAFIDIPSMYFDRVVVYWQL